MSNRTILTNLPKQATPVQRAPSDLKRQPFNMIAAMQWADPDDECMSNCLDDGYDEEECLEMCENGESDMSSERPGLWFLS